MLRSDATNLINAVVALRNGADDQTAARNVVAFPAWAAGKSYAVGERVKDEGKLYKVITAHTSQTDWKPNNTPSLYAEILPGQGGTDIGEWVQPESTNPYMKGDKVKHGGKVWVSTVDNNVWEPGVYGWEESA